MNSTKIKKITKINDDAVRYSVNVIDNHNYISTGGLLSKNCIVVDEAQNVTNEQMEMIVTRVGLRSKMIICGDDGQVDLKNKGESGFKFLYACSKKIKNLEAITLRKNHRDPIVDDLIQMYETENEKRNNKSK
jgi:phosphate starvation-inducible PhoH-like protein